MNYSNDLLIDAGLNIAGFVISGVLMMVIYSIFFKRNERQIATTSDNAIVKREQTSTEEVREPRGKVEFVNFQNNSTGETMDSVDSHEQSSRFQRNRLEVIKQAREMLNSGKSTESIRNRLPIAEAELNMINQTRNNRSIRGAANGQ